MRQTKSLAKFTIGLTIGVQKNKSLVHNGQFSIDDFLDAMHSLILAAHDVSRELVILFDFLVVPYDFLSLHLSNPCRLYRQIFPGTF